MKGHGRQDKQAQAQGLRVVFWGMLAGALPDEEQLEAAVVARLEGEGEQAGNLFDYDALPGDDD